MNSLAKLAKRRKDQRVEKIKNTILKQKLNIQLVEKFTQLTNILSELDYSIKQLTQIFKKLIPEDGNTQTPSIQNVSGTQSLRDILTLMRRNDFF